MRFLSKMKLHKWVVEANASNSVCFSNLEIPTTYITAPEYIYSTLLYSISAFVIQSHIVTVRRGGIYHKNNVTRSRYS